MHFEKNKKELLKLCELYRIVKELIIYAEQSDLEDRTSLGAINELRNAFDHIMRANATELGISPDKTKKYTKIQIDKCYGDVYRAGYDILDMLCVNYKSSINNIMKEFSSNTIVTIMPDYFDNATKVNQIQKKIAKIRAKKDVENKTYENFIEYTEEMKILGNFHEKILSNIPLFIEQKKKEKKEEGLSLAKKIIIPIILVIVGLLINFYFPLIK